MLPWTGDPPCPGTCAWGDMSLGGVDQEGGKVSKFTVKTKPNHVYMTKHCVKYCLAYWAEKVNK